jgi:hypothetical protein
VILGGDKLIWASDGDHEFYRLSEDPEERNNLIASPDTGPNVAALTVVMESLIARYRGDHAGDRTPGGPELDEETREALKALGYLR